MARRLGTNLLKTTHLARMWEGLVLGHPPPKKKKVLFHVVSFKLHQPRPRTANNKHHGITMARYSDRAWPSHATGPLLACKASKVLAEKKQVRLVLPQMLISVEGCKQEKCQLASKQEKPHISHPASDRRNWETKGRVGGKADRRLGDKQEHLASDRRDWETGRQVSGKHDPGAFTLSHSLNLQSEPQCFAVRETNSVPSNKTYHGYHGVVWCFAGLAWRLGWFSLVSLQ